MDIVFTQKTESGYRCFAEPVRRLPVSAESVVPDTQEDIGRIASVRTQLLLKSKDVTSRGVTVTGELDTVLFYITESENMVSSLQLQRDFALDFELGEIPSDTQAQIHLTVSNTEARVLNPRKISVTVEIQGALQAFVCEDNPVETIVPEEARAWLRYQVRQKETTRINGVCEKAFVLNEQYLIPESKPTPIRIVSQNVSLRTEDLQQVGSRVVIKGTVYVELWYQPENRDYPESLTVSSPFSQIVDTGAEECEGGTAHVEVTGVYFDLIDTLSGGKALDMEVHAVLQLVSRCRQKMEFVADAYSNRCPSVCEYQRRELLERSGEEHVVLSGEETLTIAEDCDSVLNVIQNLTRAAVVDGIPTATVGLDILYRRKNGELSSVRRQMELKGKGIPDEYRLESSRLSDTDSHQEGTALRSRASAELTVYRETIREESCVTGVSLQEDRPYPVSEFPTVTLVRADPAQLWSLAKLYHSSVEAIEATNENLSPGTVKLLLIPRET